jgi:hypothetical protein
VKHSEKFQLVDPDKRRERFLRDSLPIRLGGIAANLARVGSVVKFPEGRAVVESLLEESKYFIEWTAAEFELGTTVELVDVQRKLVRWQSQIDVLWNDDAQRLAIGEEAKRISNNLLERSGLLNQ